jgi:hypothetical protein
MPNVELEKRREESTSDECVRDCGGVHMWWGKNRYEVKKLMPCNPAFFTSIGS